MNKKYPFILLLLFVFVNLNRATAAWQTDTLKIADQDSVIRLTKLMIVPETLQITTIDGDSINIANFQVDALNGQLHGNLTIVDTLTVVARYNYLNLKLPTQQILNPPPRIYLPPIDHSEQKNIPVSTPKTSQGDSYDFLKSGTIYRGLTLQSNSGMSLQSGLNLELQGNISDDITIVGTLSDQNIPIQPEGNTQTLEEIDKVFIQVRMPRESITFGDYEFSNKSTSLSGYERKLQGVLIESNRHNFQSQFSGAVTKGQYTNNYFNGEEANQGPYQLVGKEGETAIIVLAGTEKVWINSEPMKRGENNDYVIDYSNGEITFTPNRLITSDSRISVDFQYSNLVYQKNIWLARNTTSLGDGKVKLTAGMISETDDKDNPIELTLSSTDIAHLKLLGDDVENVFQSTIVEDSAGVYLFNTTDSILVYYGTGGTHSASFYNVGEKGAYRKVYTANSYYFEYVDKNDPTVTAEKIAEAVYLPVKPLKLPTSQRLYHFAGQWQPSKNISVVSELAGSDLDRNTFSNLDDTDNRDLAFNIKTDIAIPITKNSQAGIDLNYRKIGKRFEPIDRLQDVEYRRKWDLPSDSTQGEQVMEANLKFNARDIVNFNLDLGSYNRNSIDANRYQLTGTVHYRWIDRLELSQEHIQRSLVEGSSEWTRQRFLFRLNIKEVKPYTELYSEERTGSIDYLGDFQFLEQHYGFEINGQRKLSGRIETYFRNDNDLENGNWIRSESSRNIAFSGQLNEWKSFSGRFTYTYRKKEYYHNDSSPNQEVQLMDVMIRQQSQKLPCSWESTMKIEEERTVKKEYRYYYVGEGEGQYVYDSTYSDYVPHVNGDYVLRIIPSEIKEPVTSFRNGFRIQLNGRRLHELVPLTLLKNMTALMDVRLQQQIRNTDNPLGILTINEKNIDDRWAYFNRIFQQDVLYYFKGRRSNLRYRYLDNNIVSQLDVRGPENSISRETSLRYKGGFIASWKLESELASKYTFRESGFNALRDRDIRSYRMENTISYNWAIVNLFECELKGAYDQDQSDDKLEAFLVGVRNSYERKLQTKGRWIAFVEVDKVNVTPKGSAIPWEMSSGKKEGNTYGWGISAEYRLGHNLSMRLNYEGWNEPDRDVYHLGGGEIRALF